MQLVSTTINPKLKIGFLLLLSSFAATAQENSPFSRYGLGNIFPGQNIVNRGMAGLSVPYSDGQSINFYNPATYSGNKLVTFDVGLMIDTRSLKSAEPFKKYTSTNFLPSYVAVAMPLNKKNNFGLAFGLRPLSLINYSITDRKRLPGIDSAANLYEGSGGLYQAFVGIGKRWGGFSIGVNGGYNFGRKETNSRLLFIPDSVYTDYASSNSSTVTSYGKAFLDAGFQYEFKVNKSASLTLAAAANFKQTLNGTRDMVRETFLYDNTGATIRVDSVSETKSIEGKINVPATYTVGLLLQTTVTDRARNVIPKSSIGVEYETSKWSEYSSYGAKDLLTDAWQLRVGGQLIPDPLSATNFWNHVSYRTGFFVGRDHFFAENKKLPVYGVSFGLGLPVRNWRGFGSTQSTIVNTALELGKRGNKDNNITENYFRLSLGFSMSDFGWFQKRRYD